MKALIDADYFSYSISFAYQTGKGEEARLKPDHKYWKYSLDKTIRDITTYLNAWDYTLYLTGKGNFRDHFPTYKANRTDFVRPILYQTVRNYMMEAHDCVLCEGVEADDQVIIDYNLDPDNTIMCHLDKDLDQAPGLHYRLAFRGKGGYTYQVTEEEGIRNLYTQALTGDAVDNIIGIKGIGKKTAEKILNGLTTEKEMYQAVRETYLKKGDTEERLINNMIQLYLLRHKDDVWRIPR